MSYAGSAMRGEILGIATGKQPAGETFSGRIVERHPGPVIEPVSLGTFTRAERLPTASEITWRPGRGSSMSLSLSMPKPIAGLIDQLMDKNGSAEPRVPRIKNLAPCGNVGVLAFGGTTRNGYTARSATKPRSR